MVDVDAEIRRMKNEIRNGDIVLFHFVDKHAHNTKQLLEPFITMAIKKGFSFDVLNDKNAR